MASWLPLSTQAIQSWLFKIYFLRCLSPFALWQADDETSLPFLLLPWLKILKGDEEPPLGIYIWSSNDQMKAKQFAESCRRRLKKQIAVNSCRRTLQNQECERNPIALLCWPSFLLLLSPEEAAASPEESVSLCKPLRRMWRQLVEGSVKTTEEEWMNAKKKIHNSKGRRIGCKEKDPQLQRKKNWVHPQERGILLCCKPAVNFFKKTLVYGSPNVGLWNPRLPIKWASPSRGSPSLGKPYEEEEEKVEERHGGPTDRCPSTLSRPTCACHMVKRINTSPSSSGREL